MLKKKQLLSIAKITFSCAIFIFFCFNTIDIKVVSNHVLGQSSTNLYQGINGATWNSKVEDFYSTSTFISYDSNGKNSYYSVDVNTKLFNNMSKYPSKIYVGYYFDKLQSVQYIYENDGIVFNQLLDNLDLEAQMTNKSVGAEVKNNKEQTQTITWCNLNPNVYITLYRIEKEKETKTILAVANKKMIDEEINLGNDTGLPTGICYRNN